MTKRAFLTPDAPINQAIPYKITVSPDLLHYVLGALTELEIAENWEESGNMTPEGSAELFADVNVGIEPMYQPEWATYDIDTTKVFSSTFVPVYFARAGGNSSWQEAPYHTTPIIPSGLYVVTMRAAATYETDETYPEVMYTYGGSLVHRHRVARDQWVNAGISHTFTAAITGTGVQNLVVEIRDIVAGSDDRNFGTFYNPQLTIVRLGDV